MTEGQNGSVAEWRNDNLPSVAVEFGKVAR